MAPTKKVRNGELDAATLDAARASLAANKPFRQRFAGGGQVRIERQLPFLFVYRPPASRSDPGTGSLVRSEASYLVAPERNGDPRPLVGTICDAVSKLFGAALVVELWTSQHHAGEDLTSGPRFRVVCEPGFDKSPTIHRLVGALGRVKLSKQQAIVSTEVSDKIAPAGLSPLVASEGSDDKHVHLLGIEIHPVHQDPSTGSELPVARRRLQRQLSRALREAAFEFSRRETRFRPVHYQALGRQAFKKVVWESDEKLAAISRKFDLLLMVTPVNGEQAFHEFEASGYDSPPNFFYRRRTIDPPLLKRELYAVPIEKIDDPTLAFLFEEKRRELGLKITLVEERETPRFLPTGIALYGDIGPDLAADATKILTELPAERAQENGPSINAREFASRAETLLAEFRGQYAAVSSRVDLYPELTSLTVSNGNLLVGSEMEFAAGRAEALLQHEVGTHIVTHWNGQAQPFQLLEVGLAGYDALQEGLAVFAEFLVGGLTRARLRTLAIRVIVARMRVEGASFVDAFRELRKGFGFSPHAAFLNSMRVFRGGGLVKDAVYLRGLQSVLNYVGKGGDLELLLIGKVATEHVAIIRELQRREVLKPLSLRPRYLTDPACRTNLERAKKGVQLLDLVGPT